MGVINDFFVYFTQLTEDRRAQPDRRPGVGHRQRHDRRRAGRDHGDDLVLRDHRHGRPRHDGVVDGGRPPRPHRAPRPAAAPARRPVADPDRRRRDHPLGHAGQALHAQLHDAVRPPRPPLRARRHGDAVVPVGEPRRGRLRRPVPLRRRPPAEQAPRVRLRRALLPRGDARPDGAARRCSPSSCRGCARSSSPASRATCRRCSSAARRACRSATRSCERASLRASGRSTSSALGPAPCSSLRRVHQWRPAPRRSAAVAAQVVVVPPPFPGERRMSAAGVELGDELLAWRSCGSSPRSSPGGGRAGCRRPARSPSRGGRARTTSGGRRRC